MGLSIFKLKWRKIKFPLIFYEDYKWKLIKENLELDRTWKTFENLPTTLKTNNTL